MIIWLVSPDEVGSCSWATARGWVRLSATRFAHPGRHDVRVVRRMSDMAVGVGPAALMIKGLGYEEGPAGSDPTAWEAWAREKPRFDEFVAAGHGVWVDADEPVRVVGEGEIALTEGNF